MLFRVNLGIRFVWAINQNTDCRKFRRNHNFDSVDTSRLSIQLFLGFCNW